MIRISKEKIIVVFGMLFICFCTMSIVYASDIKGSLANQYKEFIEKDNNYRIEFVKPTKREYKIGQEIDLTGGSGTLIRNEGEVNEERLFIPLTSDDVEIIGYNTNLNILTMFDINKEGTYFVGAVIKDTSIPLSKRALRILYIIR